MCAIFLLPAASALQALLPEHQLAVSLWAFVALVAVFVIPHLIGVLDNLRTRVLRLELIDNAKVADDHEAPRKAAKAARKAAKEVAQEDLVRGLVASLLAAQAAVVVAPAPIAPVPAANAVLAVHPR